KFWAELLDDECYHIDRAESERVTRNSLNNTVDNPETHPSEEGNGLSDNRPSDEVCDWRDCRHDEEISRIDLSDGHLFRFDLWPYCLRVENNLFRPLED